MTYHLQSHHKKIIADTITPVSVYLKVRDHYPNSILLESSDYHANDNSFSYVCFNPIASVSVKNNLYIENHPDGTEKRIELDESSDVPSLISEFSKQFSTTNEEFKFINQGLFGYMNYDAVRYFEDVVVSKKEEATEIPDLHYAVYQNIIAINHFNNEAYLFAHCYESENNIADIELLLKSKNYPTYNFSKEGEAITNVSDEDFKSLVETAKKHCQRGDVFQLVLSRRFEQSFSGDEFNVYRALRTVNPSPYLFYFDYGNFKLFGSSPEAQLVVKDKKAEIHPIAGTFKRTGNDEQDAELAKKLAADKKENAEHVMLVDLARNDLSRHGKSVEVETYREVQYFSHVIHLVSKVTAQIKESVSTMEVVADTFPAGTLSGAPKHMAMELIEKYEPTPRGYYGGAIGFMDFSGNFNHAIMIRTFLSKNHRLYFQAGAGIVAASSAESENQETYNKLGALNKALELASTI
ncbi:MAG: anthranilate synthase component I family protein [Flavobacteriaceae bacterium]|jgi:anthranilate synthase component 1|nr:anthranilate synthase component I family protein [Flavobacteriaceae bacterium]NVJ72120.1 anthranilate synthase component I family protein [Flavobacteriaceae bacterium]